MKGLVGVDEVGRGPLAGPISVGVVVALERHYPKVCRAFRTLGSGDSKTLSAARRERVARGLRRMAARGEGLGAVRSVSATYIDRRGIVSGAGRAGAAGVPGG